MAGRSPWHLALSGYILFLSGGEFLREAVLNHRIGNEKLEARQLWTGLLLGYSLGELPARYHHGETFQARIALRDQHRRLHSSHFEVRVNRVEAVEKALQYRSQSGGLFEEEQSSSAAAMQPPATDPADRLL
ncbi:MAG TPA: hypothetical protein VFA89_19355 [Terriglobales bacterium]|nr:hypothetical protein [Terriglobales bacterium]